MVGNVTPLTIDLFHLFNNSGNSDLIDLIRGAIRQSGSVTFEWFMEQALYHPELGYYSSGRCAIGRQGDYFTNVSVGPIFGQLLGAQFTEIWERLERPGDFVIVEQGAHHGDFARDVLESLFARVPDLFDTLRYWIVEPFPILRERQAETLSEFAGKLTWQESLIDLPEFSGVHFSNELIDSMPVHLITNLDSNVQSVGTAGDWLERCIVESKGAFDFASGPIKDVELKRHLARIPHPRQSPYETEVNLAALRWIENLASKLVRGYVLTVDYGYSRDDFYAPDRSAGTIRFRARHGIIPSPFTGIGETDITAHVDWTSLAERAEAKGLSLAAFTDQHHFITGIVASLMRDEFDSRSDLGKSRALKTLLHPEFLGTSFQVLALSKDLPPGSSLNGFRFGRDPRVILGL